MPAASFIPTNSIPPVPGFPPGHDPGRNGAVRENSGIKAAAANAKSKLELSYGDSGRITGRRFGFGVEYNRYAEFNNYQEYYRRFQHNNFNRGYSDHSSAVRRGRKAKARAVRRRSRARSRSSGTGKERDQRAGGVPAPQPQRATRANAPAQLQGHPRAAKTAGRKRSTELRRRTAQCGPGEPPRRTIGQHPTGRATSGRSEGEFFRDPRAIDLDAIPRRYPEVGAFAGEIASRTAMVTGPSSP